MSNSDLNFETENLYVVSPSTCLPGEAKYKLCPLCHKQGYTINGLPKISEFN